MTASSEPIGIWRGRSGRFEWVWRAAIISLNEPVNVSYAKKQRTRLQQRKRYNAGRSKIYAMAREVKMLSRSCIGFASIDSINAVYSGGTPSSPAA